MIIQNDMWEIIKRNIYYSTGHEIPYNEDGVCSKNECRQKDVDRIHNFAE